MGWNGPEQPVQGAVVYKDGKGIVRFRNKGVRRLRKAIRRQEAEARNALTPDDRRRRNRGGA